MLKVFDFFSLTSGCTTHTRPTLGWVLWSLETQNPGFAYFFIFEILCFSRKPFIFRQQRLKGQKPSNPERARSWACSSVSPSAWVPQGQPSRRRYRGVFLFGRITQETSSLLRKPCNGAPFPSALFLHQSRGVCHLRSATGEECPRKREPAGGPMKQGQIYGCLSIIYSRGGWHAVCLFLQRRSEWVWFTFWGSQYIVNQHTVKKLWVKTWGAP